MSAGLRRYHERRRQVAKVAPRDLRRLEQSGTVALALKPLLSLAAEEAYELTEALGGLDAVSPQRRVLIEDLVAIGLALRATLALFLQNGDPELASKVGTLSAARRASLQAIGLERVVKDLDLGVYLEQRAHENRASAPIVPDPDPAPATGDDDATRARDASPAAGHEDTAPEHGQERNEGGAPAGPLISQLGPALTSTTDPEGGTR